MGIHLFPARSAFSADWVQHPSMIIVRRLFKNHGWKIIVRHYTKGDPLKADASIAHMQGVTVTVWTQTFVYNKGESHIPHKIVEAVATSIQWLDHAIGQLSSENYNDPDCVLAKVYLHVYRHVVSRPVLDPSLSEGERRRLNSKFAFDVYDAISDIKDKLKKIRAGLAKNPIIKVNNESVSKKGVTKHYLGYVKPARDGNGYGNITVGFRAFRERHNLARILIHEAAHKFTLADDGKNTGGYWNEGFGDYLDPEAMDYFACLKNADSHALFVWALNVGQPHVPEISRKFAEAVENRWRQHQASLRVP
jgi:hypothetical protein